MPRYNLSLDTKIQSQKIQIEAALAEQSIQVVWFNERERP